MKRLFRKGGLRPLILLAALCVASAAVRLGGESGRAIAREVADLSAYAPLVEAGGACQSGPEVEEVLEALTARETRLDAREADLVSRQAALAAAQDRVAEKLAELRAAEEALRGTLALAEGAAEGDVARLTSVYERMKPKEAAALFETMAPEFAAGFLGRMNPEAAAAILAGLPPEVAYSLSAILAGRHAAVPTE
jgi:flagellar motility protein MotE (MotC chaperone)